MKNSNLTPTVYFDNAATTACLPQVVETLHEFYSTIYGNSSSTHQKGRQARDVLFEAQDSIAQHFQVPQSHVIFTSGGTESNNLAIWGGLGGIFQVFQSLKSEMSFQIITSTIEHDSTHKIFEVLEKMGMPVSWIKVNEEGFLNLAQLEKKLSNRTKLVSFHHVQNEVGMVQNLKEISDLVRSKQPDALIHTDAIQSFMKIPVGFEELGVDMISISGHKIGGPKGIGALILGKRFENRSPKIGSFLQGSSHQGGSRPGTIPVPLICGLSTAIKYGIKNFEENLKKLLKLRSHLISHLPAKAILNGPKDTSGGITHRAPQTVNFSITGLPSATIVEALSAQGFCISAGSACHATQSKPNATLLQMGLNPERANGSIRISFSPQNTIEETDRFLESMQKCINEFGV